MTPELFLAAAATARARAVLAGAELPADDLEPPHPAFTGFRRLAYLWEEGVTTFPIGDRIATWLDFLRGRAAFDAALAVEAEAPRVLVAHPDSVDAWTPSHLEGSPLLRGHQSGSDAAAGLPDHPVRAGLDEAAQELRTAAADATTSAAAVQRDALLRSIAILESPGDGAEVSDVAWPYFVLPEAVYPAAARRLFASAASAWPLREALPAIVAAANAGLASPSRHAPASR